MNNQVSDTKSTFSAATPDKISTDLTRVLALITDLANIICGNIDVELGSEVIIKPPEYFGLIPLETTFTSLRTLIEEKKALTVIPIDDPSGQTLCGELSKYISSKDNYRLPKKDKDLLDLCKGIGGLDGILLSIFIKLLNQKEVTESINKSKLSKALKPCLNNKEIKTVLQVVAQFISEFNLNFIINKGELCNLFDFDKELSLVCCMCIPSNYANFCQRDPLYYIPAFYFTLLKLHYFLEDGLYQTSIQTTVTKGATIAKYSGALTQSGFSGAMGVIDAKTKCDYKCYLAELFKLNPNYKPKPYIEDLLNG